MRKQRTPYDGLTACFLAVMLELGSGQHLVLRRRWPLPRGIDASLGSSTSQTLDGFNKATDRIVGRIRETSSQVGVCVSDGNAESKKDNNG